MLGESRDKFGTSLWKEIRKDWAAILDNAKFFIGDCAWLFRPCLA